MLFFLKNFFWKKYDLVICFLNLLRLSLLSLLFFISFSISPIMYELYITCVAAIMDDESPNEMKEEVQEVSSFPC